MRSPIAGTVLEQHFALGENVEAGEPLFLVVDLDHVWVDLDLPQDALSNTREGQSVRICGASDPSLAADGEISFISPVIHEQKRTALARVVLPNTDGRWRPGTFVSAVLADEEELASILVPNDAVQTLDGKPVVFEVTGEIARPREVVLGRSDEASVELLSGLSPGATFVSAGAFDLKAKLVTSSLGGHAGHGH